MNLPKSSTIENLYSNVLQDFKSTPLQGVKLLSIPEFESDFSTLGFSINGKVQMYKESKVKDITPNTPLKTMKLNLESCDNLRLNTPFASSDDLNNKRPLKNITNININGNIGGTAKNSSNSSNNKKPVNNTQNKNASNTNTNVKSNTQIDSHAHSNDKGLFKELKSLFHNKNKNKKSTNVNNTNNNTTAASKTSNKPASDKSLPSKEKNDINNDKKTDNNDNVFQKPRTIKDTSDNNIFLDKASDTSNISNSNSKSRQISKNLEIIINSNNENQNKSDLLASRITLNLFYLQ
ncbi:unnamed protein product [[Candida] boidinii]|nr:unnamed protein product [[Candida] boidinii]